MNPLETLEDAIYTAYAAYVKKHNKRPSLSVSFSRKGYRETRKHDDPLLRPLAFFLHTAPTFMHTVCGFPYEVIDEQEEDFLIHIKEELPE